MNWTAWIGSGAVMGFLGVLFGAFGSHALKARLTTEDLAIFETAVRYQMYHGFAMIAVGFMGARINSVFLQISGFAFLAGILFFSGSLYALVLSGKRELGMITPIGGTGFLVGWVMLAVAAFKPV